MRIGLPLQLHTDMEKIGGELADLENAGLDIAWVGEAYSFDAVSQLGYLAAVTKRLELGSGIFQLYTRTPSLIAMTAAGLDFVSKGRFTLGLGASGPQVIEGFHGVKFDAPLAHTRETVEICRAVWRREKLEHHGTHYSIPLPADQGTGLGKPLKLINTPVRSQIPIVLAAIGPKNVALAAEIAEGWKPFFFVAEKAADVWGASLAAGASKREPALDTLDIVVDAPVAIGEDVVGLRELMRPQLALYIGGMGARGLNYYNDLAVRYGYEREAALIQDLYLAGRKKEAEAEVPLEMLELTSLIGSEAYLRERLAAYVEAGVTTLNVLPIAGDARARLDYIERLRHLLD